jgi:hypothetical protein
MAYLINLTHSIPGRVKCKMGLERLGYSLNAFKKLLGKDGGGLMTVLGWE